MPSPQPDYLLEEGMVMHDHRGSDIISLSASAPASPINGDLWYNIATAEMAVYYNGWNVIGTGTPPTTLGTPYGLLLCLTQPT